MKIELQNQKKQLEAALQALKKVEQSDEIIDYDYRKAVKHEANDNYASSLIELMELVITDAKINFEA